MKGVIASHSCPMVQVDTTSTRAYAEISKWSILIQEAQITFCLLSSALSPVETVLGGEALIADYKMAS